MLQDAKTEPIGRREANIEERRGRILEATARLVEREGVDALSMRKLAREAKLSVTTLYNLFGSRAEILAAFTHGFIDEIDQTLDIEAPLSRPLDRARAIVTVSTDYMGEREAICRPMLQASYSGTIPTTPDRYGMARRAAGMMRAALESAHEQGLIEDTIAPDVLGSQIWHGYDMAACLWARGLTTIEQFRARALYGMYVAVLSVATDELRPQIVEELRALEETLRSDPTSGARPQPQEESD